MLIVDVEPLQLSIIPEVPGGFSRPPSLAELAKLKAGQEAGPGTGRGGSWGAGPGGGPGPCSVMILTA